MTDKISRFYKKEGDNAQLLLWIIVGTFTMVGVLFVLIKPASSPVEPEIVATEGGNALFQSQKGLPYLATFGSKKEVRQAPTKITVGKTSITMTPEMEVKEIKRENDNQITTITLDGTKFIQTLKETGVKEDIIVQEPVEKITFLANLEGVTPKKISGLWRFMDEHGREKFFIPKPFMVDASGERSEDVDISISQILNTQYQILLTPDPDWLADPARVYPVTIDPSIEITILNVHSHPQAGDNWEVSFETTGMADLTITPDDQATIDDLDFVSLKCGDEERTPQILDGDVIFYPNWECNEEGSITHHVNVAGKHTLKFQFGDQIAYAYNDPWWNSSWDYRFKYTIDNSGVGETLTDFPLHIDLTNDAPANFWTNVSSETGDDIRIVDEDYSTDLSSQAHLEGFSKASSKGHIWVKRTITANVSTEFVYIYYGNSGASSPFSDTTKQATYNSAYAGVWHLDETSGTHYDATDNNSDSAGETVTQQGADIGKIDGADEFDDVDDIVYTNDAASLGPADDMTLEAWFKLDQKASDLAHEVFLVAKPHTETPWAAYILRVLHDNDLPYFVWFNDEGTQYQAVSWGEIAAGSWYYLVGVRDGSNIRIYVNGAEDSDEAGTPTRTLLDSDSGVHIGSHGGWEYYADGIIDEVRLSSTPRSAEWIEFAYLSGLGNAGTAGSEEAGATPAIRFEGLKMEGIKID